MTNIPLSERISGCLIGGAIGELMGFPLMWTSAEEIAERHGIVRNFLPFRRGTHAEGRPKPDDLFLVPGRNDEYSELMKAVATTYIVKGWRITAADFGKTLVGIDPWRTSLVVHTVVELLQEGMPARIAGSLNTEALTAAISIAPVGLFNAGDPDHAYIDAREIASVLVRDAGVVAAGVHAAMVAEACRQGATPSSVIEVGLELVKRHDAELHQELSEAVSAAAGASHPLALAKALESIKPRRFFSGPNSSSMAATFAVLAAWGDQADRAISGAVSLGGTERTGGAQPAAVAGALVGGVVGALHGLQSLPQEWVAHAQQALDYDIAGLSAQLSQVVMKKAQREAEIRAQCRPLLTTPKEGRETLLGQKIFGCLLGGAIGNAMGSPVEGDHYLTVRQKHGTIDTLLEPQRLETEDDCMMGLHLCQALIEKGGQVTSDDFARIWRRDMDPKRFFFCMRNSWELLKRDIPPRLAGHWNIVTGSTLMAVAPVGLFNAGDPDQAYLDATDPSYMYQRGLDVEVACIFAAAVAEAMKPEATVDSVIRCALDHASVEPFASFYRRRQNNVRETLQHAVDVAASYKDPFAAFPELYEKCLQWHPIDPLEVLALTLAVFRIAGGDTRLAIIGGTNIGRDADTIPNLNGALCGALYGFDSIPKEWVALVGERSMRAFHTAAEGLERLVRRRLETIAQKL